MKPKLIINQDVVDEIMFYVNKSQYEVSGMGKVVVEPGGVLRVVSQIMLPQKNRTTHTQVEPEDINKLLFEMGESPRFWWHSHVNMSVFWSGEDMSTIKENAGPAGWFVNTVFNQKGEKKSAFYAAKGFVTPWGDNPIWYDDLETVFDRPIDPAKEALWAATYDKNVTNISGYGHGGNGGHYYPGYAQGGNKNIVPMGEHRGRNTNPRSMSGLSDTITSLFDTEPPEKRPPTIGKHAFKLWKKIWKDKQMKENPMTPKTDEYGYDQSDRQFLATAGYFTKDIEELLDKDFSGNEILELAMASYDVPKIQALLDAKMTPEGILAQLRFDAEKTSVKS